MMIITESLKTCPGCESRSRNFGDLGEKFIYKSAVLSVTLDVVKVTRRRFAAHLMDSSAEGWKMSWRLKSPLQGREEKFID